MEGTVSHIMQAHRWHHWSGDTIKLTAGHFFLFVFTAATFVWGGFRGDPRCDPSRHSAVAGRHGHRFTAAVPPPLRRRISDSNTPVILKFALLLPSWSTQGWRRPISNPCNEVFSHASWATTTEGDAYIVWSVPGGPGGNKNVAEEIGFINKIYPNQKYLI